MVNANELAMEFHSLLPEGETPAHTEGREGFYHLTDMGGNAEEAFLEYIIRDHDRAKFEARKQLVKQAAAEMQKRHGEDSTNLWMQDSYYNMGEVIQQHFHLVENAELAIRKAGLEPITYPVRGGTDGSRLSFMGLPCPNLGTGGFYFHGPNECASAQRMDKCMEILRGIVSIYAKVGADI